MESNIKKAILKYRDLIPTKIFKRDTTILKSNLEKANAIIGPRRSGKTYYLYDIYADEKNPVFLNFEDGLLTGIKSKDLNIISDISKELFGIKKFAFFFDEIQSVDNWERFVISLLNEHHSVYLSGSNSRLLSKEIATSLRGKSLPYLMLPLSFREFLKFKGFKLAKNYEYTDEVFEIKRLFKEFFYYGGFPELVLSDSIELKNRLINNYFDSVMFKDILERLELKNIKLVEVTMKYLLNNFGNLFSISAFEKYLKSNKFPYSLEDIYKIIRALEDTFMFGFVKGFFKSYKKTEFSKSKVYLFDVGYVHFLALESEDFGRILENVVFIELFRREGCVDNRNIYYYGDGNECDFLLTERDKPTAAIQVCYKLNERNRERETKGLVDALTAFDIKEGLILTYDQEDEFKTGGKKIKVKPVWKWLLE